MYALQTSPYHSTEDMRYYKQPAPLFPNCDLFTLCHWLCFRARLKGNIVLVSTKVIRFTELRHPLSKRKVAGKAAREPLLTSCNHRNGQYTSLSRIRLLVNDKQSPQTFIFLVSARNNKSYGGGESHRHHHCYKRWTATYQEDIELFLR